VTTQNDLAPLTAPDSNMYADLPPHVYDERGLCAYCDDEPSQHTYDTYVAQWYELVWEGERGHRPIDRAEWEWLAASCLAGLLDDEPPSQWH
jgi:hypothetical protein